MSADPMKLLLAIWPPMLATLAGEDAIEDPARWIFEPKYDGFRAVAALSGGKVSLETTPASEESASSSARD